MTTTTATTTNNHRRKRWRLSSSLSSSAVFLLSLPWMPSQASTTRYRQNRSRQDSADTASRETAFSYWDHAGGTEIGSLHLEYPGQHPHSRHLLLDEEHSQSKRNLEDNDEDISKFGFGPNRSDNSNNNDDQSQSTTEEDRTTDFASTSISSLQNDRQNYDNFEDDDMVRNQLLYDHLYDARFGDDPNDDTAPDDNNPSYQPIRIHFITTPLEERRGESAFLDQQIEELLETAIPEAARLWQSHVSVYPVVGAITVEHDVCYGSYSQHLLGVFGDEQPQSKDIYDADIVILVSAYDALATPDGDTMPVCGLRSLAMGAACSLDQWDRPVVGFINLCLSDQETSEQPFELDELVSQAFQAHFSIQQPRQASQEQQLRQQQNDASVADHHRVPLKDIMVHEIAHTFGFDSYLFKYFRNGTTGEPLTPRPFQTSTVQCANEEDVSEQRGFPSSKVLQMGRNANGDVYYDIVTPRVAQVVQNHFQCHSLAGARLENYEDSCVGSHWDERLYLSDILSPALEWRNNQMSPLTLALLEDTGWYKVDYRNTTSPSFGLGAGCDFVEDACIVNDKVAPYAKGFFCDNPIRLQEDIANEESFDMAVDSWNIVCDPTHQYWAMCDLWDNSTIPDFLDTRFPAGNQASKNYFSDVNLMVSFPQADFCPLAIDYLFVDCQVEESGIARQETYLGEQAGPESRCVNAYSENSGEQNRRVDRPACMHVECDAALQKIVLGKGDFRQVCDYDGQVLQIPSSESDYLECPRATVVCPQFFCQSSCSGRGVCDIDGTNDLNKHPTCKCFDPLDTSAGCYGEDAVTEEESITHGDSPPDLGLFPNDFPILSSSRQTLFPSIYAGWVVATVWLTQLFA